MSTNPQDTFGTAARATPLLDASGLFTGTGVFERALLLQSAQTAAWIGSSGGDGGGAFGWPGLPPSWCSSDKDFVTTSLGNSRLWATVGHGIINEVYWPSSGEPQVRDFGFYLVGAKCWHDLKRLRRYRLRTPGPYLPLLTIEHYGPDYELTLEILPDPVRDVLLVRFDLQGPYRLVLMVAPHLGASGRDNTAWIQDGKGYARRGEAALCLTANTPLRKLSCGYVGQSDGWQDLARNGHLTWRYGWADNGTVAITAEAAAAKGVVALGFADHAHGAATLAGTALAEDFQDLRASFLQGWGDWGARLTLPSPDKTLGDAALFAATVIKTHEDRAYPGAVVASLSVPWGNSTDTLGGYHLVWPRDATMTAFALLAARQVADVRRMMAHMIASQSGDGHWPQNYFPSGAPFWTGVQLDETGFPVLLAAKLRELGEVDLPGTATMVRHAMGFIARTGPSSDQDRWEENPGVSPFTLAVAIAALVAGAQWLEADERDYCLSLADDWNERLEGWCYAEGGPLARRLGVSGYYVRLGMPTSTGDVSETVILRNRAGEPFAASTLVSMDFSYLVRLGLRAADDRRVQDTLAVVDSELRVNTPSGPVYYRYNDDGYGEHADGRPFDGTGIGRAWPLLSGERGHLALAAGHDPLPYLTTMLNCASAGGLMPEQVWDSAPIPTLGLEPGRPSGSAMPLLWAHAEFLKLLVARDSGRPVELLDVVEQRYGVVAATNARLRGDARAPAWSSPPAARRWQWRDEVPVARLAEGRALMIESRQAFTLHFGFDGWQHVQERVAMPQPFGMWGVELSPQELAQGSELNFTRRFHHGWENVNHRVGLGHVDLAHALHPTL